MHGLCAKIWNQGGLGVDKVDLFYSWHHGVRACLMRFDMIPLLWHRMGGFIFGSGLKIYVHMESRGVQMAFGCCLQNGPMILLL